MNLIQFKQTSILIAEIHTLSWHHNDRNCDHRHYVLVHLKSERNPMLIACESPDQAQDTYKRAVKEWSEWLNAQ